MQLGKTQHKLAKDFEAGTSVALMRVSLFT